MRPDPSRVREWGRANGWPVGERGRISAELFEAYEYETRNGVTVVAGTMPVATSLLNGQPKPAAGALVLDTDTGHTFAWEGEAWVIRDPEGVECFRHTLGYKCAEWASDRGIKL